MSVKLGVFLVVASFMLNLQARGCPAEGSWNCPESNLPGLSLEEAKQQLSETMGVKVDLAPGYARCSSSRNYTIWDSEDGEKLGEVPVPKSGDQVGQFLLVRVKQLLRTPRESLKSLVQAKSLLLADSRKLEERYGVDLSDPNALPDEYRFPNNGAYQVFELIGWECQTGGAERSSGIIYQKVRLGLTQYVSGRHDYPESEIYSSGDLFRALFLDAEIFGLYKERVRSNADLCQQGSWSNFNWTELLTEIEEQSLEQLLDEALKL
jgi:hypothetical protein